MQEIADWLDKLGMSEYMQRFAENKIDVSVLRHLTDQDLKDIGVPLGHRRKMLATISEPEPPQRESPSPRGLNGSPRTLPSAAKSPSCFPT
jgi:hypothetical protein